MGNILSIFLYTAVAAECLIIAATKIKDKPKFCFWFIVITLTLLAGLRHQTVGIDTAPYVISLSTLRDNFAWKVINIDEPAFLILSYLLVKISNGYTLMLMVFAFIINFLVVKRLYDLRDEISFPWAIFIFIMQYYFTTFNTMRQWIAIAIVFYFSKYISVNKKGALIYAISVAFATLFHKSALIAVALIPFFYLIKKSNTKLQRIIKLIVLLIITPAVSVALLTYLMKNYGFYLNPSSGTKDISFIALSSLLFLVFTLILSLIEERKNNSGIGMLKSDEQILAYKQDTKNFEVSIAMLGALCALMVFFYRYLDRLGTYFMMFEMIVYPRYIKNNKFKLLVIVFVVLIFTYLRIMSFISNGYGEMPYIPFWHKL